MTCLADPEDQRLVDLWLGSEMTMAEAARHAGCSTWRIGRALDRLRVPAEVRRAKADRAWKRRVDEQRRARVDRVRARALELEKQDIPTAKIARELGVSDQLIRGILRDAGIDLQARARRLRYARRVVHNEPRRDPPQCTRCGWIISTVTILNDVPLPYMYDDLCFPCWFELTEQRACSPENLGDAREVLAMARRYQIAAIETEYQGYRFRSRLEARWAVFLDTLGLEWEYEKEGYRLANGIPYLPDFWLPELECWLEIKGNDPTAEERLKALLLAEGTGYPVFVFVGLPSVSDPARPTGFVAQGQEWAAGWGWQQCDLCGSVALAAGKPGRCQACHEGTTSEEAQPLQVARSSARGARFEHNGRI